MEPGLAALAARFALERRAQDQLRVLLRLVANDPLAPTSVRRPRDVLDRHFGDSLVALDLDPVRSAAMAVDLGSGAGFPGLPLAIGHPAAHITLLESGERKCEFLQRAVVACELDNVSVANARAEDWQDGRARFDLATARALARLDVVMEYAAPLLAVGGHLVAWRGRREPDAEAAAERAAEVLGMRTQAIVQVCPFPGAQARHLHLFSKVMETPPRFPRRAGMATKRPLGGRSRRPSDRLRR